MGRAVKSRVQRHEEFIKHAAEMYEVLDNTFANSTWGRLTIKNDMLAALVTAVGVTFIKSSKPQNCLASLKLNSIWNLKL
jgi:hypothetical protein